MQLEGRKIYPGIAVGEALVTAMGISFFGGVDPENGVIVERGHELEGQSISGKVLVFPSGKGSTVGSYTLYRLKVNGKAPAAIVNAECETITAVGCIIAEIPCVDHIPVEKLKTGMQVLVDAGAGVVEILSIPPLPEPLRGSDPDSFPQRTITTRLPSIAQRTLDETDWPEPAHSQLQALINEMPHGLLRLLEDDTGPDVADWQAYIAPHLGQTWLQPPWFVVETYFFRRILEATGYYKEGADRGVDPYAPQKRQELAGVYAGMRGLCAQLDALIQSSELETQKLTETLIQILHANIWGNQADLSMWPGGSGNSPPRPQGDRLSEHLLVDQAPEVARFLAGLAPACSRLDFILDNSGLELAYDLGLADFLLTKRLAGHVRFHAKPHPTYVSDATIQDVLDMVAFLESAPDACLRALALRLHDHFASDKLRLFSDYFWTSPLSGWQMPPHLRQELGKADLIVSKGDANYRRWLGDRYWPHTTPLEDILAYRPAPVLALRVLKSNLVTGLQPGQSEAMDRKDPTWLHDGNWGVIQFVY
jgi:predicted aconitase with swiveling domain